MIITIEIKEVNIISAKSNFKIIFLSKQVSNKAEFFEFVLSEVEFPDYFSFNWDSFEEIIIYSDFDESNFIFMDSSTMPHKDREILSNICRDSHRIDQFSRPVNGNKLFYIPCAIS